MEEFKLHWPPHPPILQHLSEPLPSSFKFSTPPPRPSPPDPPLFFLHLPHPFKFTNGIYINANKQFLQSKVFVKETIDTFLYYSFSKNLSEV